MAIEMTDAEKQAAYDTFCKDREQWHDLPEAQVDPNECANSYALSLAIARDRARVRHQYDPGTKEERKKMTAQQGAADAVLHLGDCGLALLNVDTLKGIIAGAIAEHESAVVERLAIAARQDVE